MIFKTFDYKGQMVNYFSKAKSNPNITFLIKYLDGKTGKYTVAYQY